MFTPFTSSSTVTAPLLLQSPTHAAPLSLATATAGVDSDTERTPSTTANHSMCMRRTWAASRRGGCASGAGGRAPEARPHVRCGFPVPRAPPQHSSLFIRSPLTPPGRGLFLSPWLAEEIRQEGHQLAHRSDVGHPGWT